MKNEDIKFAFFGTPELSVTVLDELEEAGLVPAAVVTRPDKPSGRGNKLTAPPVKRWAQERDIKVLQPKKIDDDFFTKLAAIGNPDIFVVAAYGKILPKKLLDTPAHGTLNVHPSLLPRLRGPSPIRSAILQDEKETGVTIMALDEEMDHGPILAQEYVEVPEWPPFAAELENQLAQKGGALLAKIMPQWVAGTIAPQEQDHDAATYCHFLKKEDMEINLGGDSYQNLLKIRGYEGLGPFTYFERNGKKIRVVITRAHLDEEGALVIERVIPEGKKEMSYEDFLRSGATPVYSG